MVDAFNPAAEFDPQIRTVRRDDGAVAFDDSPVHAGIDVSLEVPRGNPIQLGAAVPSADCIDHRVPAILRLEVFCGGAVRFVFLDRLRAFAEASHHRKERRGVFLMGDLSERTFPGRPRTIDVATLPPRDRDPGILVGRMQPATTEIERKAHVVDDRPGAPPEARPRLDEERVDALGAQAAGGGDPRRPTAYDHHFSVAVRH